MRKSKPLAVLAALLYSLPAFVLAQSATVRESAEINNYERELFRPSPGNYVAINYGGLIASMSARERYKKTRITGYDANLNEKYSNLIEELTRNRYYGAFEINKKLQLIYADDKGIYTIELDGLNGQTSKPAALLTLTNKPTGLYKGFSPDSSLCYAVFTCPSGKKDQAFEGIVMDKQMNIRTRFSFPLEKLKPYINQTTCILSSEGVLYIINAVRTKSDKNDYRPLQYFVTEVNKEGKTVTTHLADLPAGNLNNLVWENSKNGLSFTGLLSKTEKEGYKALLSGEFSSWSKKVTRLKEAVLSNASFGQQTSGSHLLQVKSSGIPPNASIVNHFTQEDGSLLLVLQPKVTIHTMRGSSSYSDTYTGSIYILRIKPDRELDWAQVIPLQQMEPTIARYCGSIPMLYKRKELLVFFHDHIKNTGPLPDEKAKTVVLEGSWPSVQLTAFHVKENGSLNRIPVANAPTDKGRLAPHEPYIIFEDEIIYTTFYYRSMGRSTHRLGTIKIN